MWKTKAKTGYQYKHLLCQSKFDHHINEVTFQPNLNTLGIEGWRVIKIIPTKEDGWFDVFLEREIIKY